MSSLLHDLSVVYGQDDVGILYGGQPVGDHYGCPSLYYLVDCGLDLLFRNGVHGSRRFVQHHDLRICDYRSRKRYKLLFSRRKKVPSFSDICLYPLLKFIENAFQRHQSDGALYLFLSRIRLSVNHVVPDGPREKVRCLKHVSESRMEPEL